MLTSLELANLKDGITSLGKLLNDNSSILGLDDENHADTHVESLTEVSNGDLASLGKPLEDLRNLVRGNVNVGIQVLGQNAGNILVKTTTGNVGQTENEILLNNRKKGLDVDSSRGQERLTHSDASGSPWRLVTVRQTRDLQDLSNKRKAIGVNARRSHAKYDIASSKLVEAGKNLGSLNSTDAGTVAIVVITAVKTRHLSSLTANEGAARLDAALRDTGNKLSSGLAVELARSKIVEEEQGFSTLNNEIIDAHSNEIDADGIVNASGLSNDKLGANTIGGTDKEGILVTSSLEVKDTTKTTNLGISTGSLGSANTGLDLLNKSVAFIDIDTSLGICNATLVGNGLQVTETSVSDISSKVLAFEADLVNTLVSELEGLFQSGSSGRGSNDTAASSHNLTILDSSSGMENPVVLRSLGNSDDIALLVRFWVAGSRHDDSSSKARRDLDVDRIQASLSAGKEDLSKIGLLGKKRKDGLGLGVTESDIVLKNLGAILGKHDASEENTDKGEAILSHTSNGGLEDVLADLLEKLRSSNRSRGVSTHATSVQTSISFSNSLVILRRRKVDDGVTVREGQDRELITLEEFLNDNLVTSVTKGLVLHNLLESSVSLLLGLRNQNALAGSKTRSLDNDIVVDLGNISLGLFVISKVFEFSSRNIVLGHEVLGESLGAFHDGGLLGRTKGGDANLSEGSLDTVNQRLLRTGNNQVDIGLQSKLDQLGEVTAANVDVLDLRKSAGSTTIA